VQIGAYTTRTEASQLAKKVTARGYAARVVGTKSPYKVQIGFYRTRAQAESERKTLAAHALTGFVTDAQQ
jgi:cell division protein FtsN